MAGLDETGTAGLIRRNILLTDLACGEGAGGGPPKFYVRLYPRHKTETNQRLTHSGRPTLCVKIHQQLNPTSTHTFTYRVRRPLQVHKGRSRQSNGMCVKTSLLE